MADSNGWRRSSHCNTNSSVEVKIGPGGGAAVRDGKDPDGPVLVFTPVEWAAFLAGVRAGEFGG
jgi:hypothetical protein